MESSRADLATTQPGDRLGAVGRASALTARECQVLALIVDGKSSMEIASDLGIKPNTASVHRNNIMKKVGYHKTAQLVVYAIRTGLVDVGRDLDLGEAG